MFHLKIHNAFIAFYIKHGFRVEHIRGRNELKKQQNSHFQFNQNVACRTKCLYFCTREKPVVALSAAGVVPITDLSFNLKTII